MFLEVTREIHASPEQVWAILADVERWPEWTKSMTKITRARQRTLRRRQQGESEAAEASPPAP